MWLLFAALVTAGAWLFLRACGLDAAGLDFCPVPVDHHALIGEAAAGDALARQVHMAQLALAAQPPCAPGAEPARRADTKALDRTVVERGGRNGRLQFTLSWETLDDLDLNVGCPGGRIDSRPAQSGPGICGDGRKDVDANRNLTDNVSARPIENIVWQSDVPQGAYVIEVIEYRAAANQGNSVPFTLRIRWDGREKVCGDVVTALPPARRKNVGGRIVAGTERLLTWTLGDALPECRFVVQNTFQGGDKG